MFEYKPRSLVPIAFASAVADGIRWWFAHNGWVHGEPLFGVHATIAGPRLFGALVVGLAGGLAARVMTKAVYGAEDGFKRLPIHWMWWPAIGGVVVGVGGLIEPRALGSGTTRSGWSSPDTSRSPRSSASSS